MKNKALFSEKLLAESYWSVVFQMIGTVQDADSRKQLAGAREEIQTKETAIATLSQSRWF
jgi:hypothetical protein